MKFIIWSWSLLAYMIGTYVIMHAFVSFLTDVVFRYSLHKLVLVSPGIYLYWGTHTKDSKLVRKEFNNLRFTRTFWRIGKLEILETTVYERMQLAKEEV